MNNFVSFKDLAHLESDMPRFVNVGHVIVNQNNPKNRDPVVIKDVDHLIGIKECSEARPKGEKNDDLYVVSYIYLKN